MFISDEKEKFDPTAFRDSIFSGITESNGDLEALYKFLDVSGGKLDYRKYGEFLFDILIAGGILAPGGTVLPEQDPSKVTRTDLCIFARPDDDESIKSFWQVITKLIRRYKYLEKTLEESIGKIIVFQKAFSPEERTKLAKLTALLISGGQIPPQVINKSIQDHLVKENIASEFLIQVLKTWQSEKDATTIWTSIRKASLDSKLLVV